MNAHGFDPVITAEVLHGQDFRFFCDALSIDGRSFNASPYPLLQDLLRRTGIKKGLQSAMPFRAVLDQARRAGATTMLVEYPYIDMEYSLARNPEHVNLHKHPCWRLHFFSISAPVLPLSDFDASDFLLAGVTHGITSDSYVGFTTIRPERKHQMGRTCVSLCPSTLGGSVYIRGISEHWAHLGALRLPVSTVPFMQQDPSDVGKCATASIWVALNILAAEFSHRYLYPEISRRASSWKFDSEEVELTAIPKKRLDAVELASELMNAHMILKGKPEEYNPPKPSDVGLKQLHIVTILRSMTESEPVSEESRTNPDLSAAHFHELVYVAQESRLPAILLLEGESKHALTVVGHRAPALPDSSKRIAARMSESLLDRAYPNQMRSFPGRHHSISLLVDQYIVHDESSGPFCALEFRDSPSESRSCPVVLTRHGGEKADFVLKGVVIARPPHVRNWPTPLVPEAVHWLMAHYAFMSLNDRDHFLWRTLLLEGSAFKRSLAARNMPVEIQRAYAKIHLPKYVWVMEYSVFRQTKSEFQRIVFSRGERPIQGEILYDTRYEGPRAPLAWRFETMVINSKDILRSPKAMFAYDTCERSMDGNIMCYK